MFCIVNVNGNVPIVDSATPKFTLSTSIVADNVTVKFVRHDEAPMVRITRTKGNVMRTVLSTALPPYTSYQPVWAFEHTVAVQLLAIDWHTFEDVNTRTFVVVQFMDVAEAVTAED